MVDFGWLAARWIGYWCQTETIYGAGVSVAVLFFKMEAVLWWRIGDVLHILQLYETFKDIFTVGWSRYGYLHTFDDFESHWTSLQVHKCEGKIFDELLTFDTRHIVVWVTTAVAGFSEVPLAWLEQGRKHYITGIWMIIKISTTVS